MNIENNTFQTRPPANWHLDVEDMPRQITATSFSQVPVRVVVSREDQVQNHLDAALRHLEMAQRFAVKIAEEKA